MICFIEPLNGNPTENQKNLISWGLWRMHSSDLWPLWLSRPCMIIWWTSWLTAALTTRLRMSWWSWARLWSIRSTSSSWRISALSSNANNRSRFISLGIRLAHVMTEWVLYLSLDHVFKLCAHWLCFRCHHRWGLQEIKRRKCWADRLDFSFCC